MFLKGGKKVVYLVLAITVVLLLVYTKIIQLPVGATGGVKVVVEYEKSSVTPSIRVSPNPATVTPISPTSAIHLPGGGILQYITKYLELRVDKECYRLGDRVVITLINRGSKVIELANPPWSVYRLVNDYWVKVYEPLRVTATTTVTLPKTPPKTETLTLTVSTVTIKPGCSVSWIWNLKVGGKPATPGKYVVTLKSPIYVKVGDEEMEIYFGRTYLKEHPNLVAYFTVRGY